MNLAIDIGNSAVKFGWFRGRTLTRFISVPDGRVTIHPAVERIGVSSVVPSSTKTLVRLARRYGIKPTILTPSGCGLRLKVRQPGKIGVDRIVNARAAAEIGRGAVVIIDTGTAVTIDVVSARKEFIGGAILPGPDLWLRSLTRAALLPKVDFAPDTPLIGKDTREAMRAGVKYGLSFAVDGIAAAMRDKYGASTVVLTGGWSGKFTRRLKTPHLYRPYLTLEGINIILGEM